MPLSNSVASISRNWQTNTFPLCAPESPSLRSTMAGKKKSKSQKAAAKPAFDEAALSKLTAKIDTGLSKPKSDSKPQKSKQKLKDERPGKRKRIDDDNTKDANPKKRQAQEPKHGSGKPKKSHAPKDKKADLLEEIRLLGGDEADLELVAGLDSDAEDGQGTKPNKAVAADMDNTLKNELAKFAAGLGFEKVRDEDGATDDEAEEQDDKVEHGDSEDGLEADEEEEKAPPAEKSQGRSTAGKLVSVRYCFP